MLVSLKVHEFKVTLSKTSFQGYAKSVFNSDHELSCSDQFKSSKCSCRIKLYFQ